MRSIKIVMLTVLICLLFRPGLPAGAKDVEIDPYEMQSVCGRFQLAKLIPLDNGHAWGFVYADVYGKIFVKRATQKGWKTDWELVNLGAKVRNFFILDIENDGVQEMVIATMSGRLLIYSMGDYRNIWENLEDDFTSIEAVAVKNVDNDPQMEIVVLADKKIYIIDALDKSRQWISSREFVATEILIDNIDKDDQQEIILNTGIIIDTKFRNVEIEWNRPFGDKILTFDINSDGYLDIIGEFSDYSILIFDTYAQREVW
ncbi:MAG: hypothetical protein JXB45_00760 [Candidatus Krumholzibacteriota bacterium]|nr:hypothetical protein [Candidatus Krumholzibacteriota bacterium]